MGMRNPKRVPEISDKLKSVWSTYPDLRLGQLIFNAMRGEKQELFYIEDDKLISLIESLVKK